MKFDKKRFYLSAPRLNRYLQATGNSQTKAVRLYMANLRLVKAFHPVIGLFEVIVRNCINNELSAHFKDPDWIINQKNGFMNDPSLTYIHPKTGKRIQNKYLRSKVIRAEKELNKRNAVVTSGKVIAEQTFGFWTSLFEKTHYRLLQGSVIKIFNNLPSGKGRIDIKKSVNRIRKFRNRINHNEPICFKGSTIDLKDTLRVHHDIYNMLEWIDPELPDWVETIDSIDTQIKFLNTYKP